MHVSDPKTNSNSNHKQSKRPQKQPAQHQKKKKKNQPQLAHRIGQPQLIVLNPINVFRGDTCRIEKRMEAYKKKYRLDFCFAIFAFKMPYPPKSKGMKLSNTSAQNLNILTSDQMKGHGFFFKLKPCPWVDCIIHYSFIFCSVERC